MLNWVAKVDRWEPETWINSLQTVFSTRRLGVNGGKEGNMGFHRASKSRTRLPQATDTGLCLDKPILRSASQRIFTQTVQQINYAYQMPIRCVDIAGPTHYRWGPMGKREDEAFLHMIEERQSLLNGLADRNAFYERIHPEIKKAYEDAKAANNDHLLNPPLYPEP